MCNAPFAAADRIGQGVEDFIAAELDAAIRQILANAEPVPGQGIATEQAAVFGAGTGLRNSQNQQRRDACQQADGHGLAAGPMSMER